MWLICGLGNPGKKYKYNRHNVGFLITEKIIINKDFDLIKKDKIQETHKGFIDNQKCIICQPQAFMNLSGQVIAKISKLYKIPNSKIIVIHDDIDLSLGKIKVKYGGGNGGHNGLMNIDNNIGISYRRLRFGVGHPGSKNLVNKYVLSNFNSDEKIIVKNIIDSIVENIDKLLENRELFLTRLSLKNHN
tara:strand:- start:1161 stop:1727 length:567 start_codon:yes stop_codon:yes gene_type:complete